MQGIVAIRNWIKYNLDDQYEDFSKRTRIIYGGPVTADNAEKFIKRYECDGFLLLDHISRDN